nr:hypothetical protein B0A51_12085 [Rachicladosporium sp. CCFEE 5018]
MPSRLSRVLSRYADKEKEALAEAEARGRPSPPPAPPTYAENQQPPQYDLDDAIPPPDITAGFSNLSLSGPSTDKLPTVDETIAHLKLLECFYRLRQIVGKTDGAFSVSNSPVPADAQRDELLVELAEKRWAIYVARAVDRFDNWITAIAPAGLAPTMTSYADDGDSGAYYKPGFSKRELLVFNESNMPPVDVLMVWHAYMLNPRAYFEDCIRGGKMHLWNTKFPWAAVVPRIDSKSFAYAAKDAEMEFQELTGLPWDCLDGPSMKTVSCPTCRKDTKVPWTTCDQNEWASAFPNAIGEMSYELILDRLLERGTGYCEPDFKQACTHCNVDMSHDNLRADKFCRDVKSLIADDTPMPGTLLSPDGVPIQPSARYAARVHKSSFNTINNLLKLGLGQDILDKPRLRGAGKNCSITGIRDMLEQCIMDDASYVRVAKGTTLSGVLTRGEKILFRKMMSRYWENDSPFALNLVGAVIRQGSFIEKMHNIDWLHSPALLSTMSRLITKYSRFMDIMKDPLHMAVPTLDVDLAWHTHQLHPTSYFAYTIDVTRQFIDHDDKVPETQLNDAFAWTSKYYQKLYKEPYSECTCWYCESVRESATSSVSRLFNTSSAQVADQLHSSPQDPKKSVHISAHNAVRPTDDSGKYDKIANEKAAKLEAAYQAACTRAKKKGKPAPKKDDYYYSDVYGYPVYMPMYMPYYGAMPYTAGYYAVAPGCMTYNAGAAGVRLGLVAALAERREAAGEGLQAVDVEEEGVVEAVEGEEAEAAVVGVGARVL